MAHVPTFTLRALRTGGVFSFVDCDHIQASELLSGSDVLWDNGGDPVDVHLNDTVVVQIDHSDGTLKEVASQIQVFAESDISNPRASNFGRGWFQFDFKPSGGPDEEIHIGDGGEMRILL